MGQKICAILCRLNELHWVGNGVLALACWLASGVIFCSESLDHPHSLCFGFLHDVVLEYLNPTALGEAGPQSASPEYHRYSLACRNESMDFYCCLVRWVH